MLVWDLPQRLFHWLAVASFAGAWLTAESERWHALHVSLGYGFAGLIAFRLLWGFVGSRHARFASFVRGPAAVTRYLGSLLRGSPEHHGGHNPAGGWSVLALLTLGGAVAASGWFAYSGASHAAEEVHEAIANGMLALVGLHVAAVLLSSLLHHENLVAAMFSGRKQAMANEAIGSRRPLAAAVLLAALAGLGAWLWQSPPASGEGHRHGERSHGGHSHGEHGHDDD